MNLYAIRDRLIDYFMVPFPAPDHSQVKAAIAAQINNGDSNAISQAPHQFEIWQLAELDTEEGHVYAKREYLCDCSSLIRAGIRTNTEHGLAAPIQQRADAQGQVPSTPRSAGSDDTASNGIPQGATPAEALQGTTAASKTQ